MSIYNAIGEKMKKIRKESRKTQFEIAEELFIHPKHYGKIERGCVETKIDTLEKFVTICNIDLECLFEKPCNDNLEEIIAEILAILSTVKIHDAQKILKIIKILIS